ncbi:hypothetical protein I350_08298 [Cryptococcus amylolentus CBS 6273]|uniref:Uncharacterized protein n=1 Tax=Cryptococcus amylolentus CBS 6273 TaxID=1296118 RepID=A0A1E3J5Z4_9TREE|nr:hypothetical protein I350_08298 [Cryptococcus amylolentus CBS 6273]
MASMNFKKQDRSVYGARAKQHVWVAPDSHHEPGDLLYFSGDIAHDGDASYALLLHSVSEAHINTLPPTDPMYEALNDRDDFYGEEHVFVSGPLEKRIDGVYCMILQSMHSVGNFASSASSSSPQRPTVVHRRPNLSFPHEPPVESSFASAAIV